MEEHIFKKVSLEGKWYAIWALDRSRVKKGGKLEYVVELPTEDARPENKGSIPISDSETLGRLTGLYKKYLENNS